MVGSKVKLKAEREISPKEFARILEFGFSMIFFVIHLISYSS